MIFLQTCYHQFIRDTFPTGLNQKGEIWLWTAYLVDFCPSRWWCWNDHTHTVHGINLCDVWNLIEKRGILHVNWCRMSSICCDVLWFRSPEISTVLPWKDERVTSNVDPGFPRGTANKLAITGSWFLEQRFPYIIYIIYHIFTLKNRGPCEPAMLAFT